MRKERFQNLTSKQAPIIFSENEKVYMTLFHEKKRFISYDIAVEKLLLVTEMFLQYTLVYKMRYQPILLQNYFLR